MKTLLKPTIEHETPANAVNALPLDHQGKTVSIVANY